MKHRPTTTGTPPTKARWSPLTAKHRPLPVAPWRLAVAATIGAAALATGIGALAAQGTPWSTPAVSGSDVIHSGAVVRFSAPDGTPSLHCNAAHACAGVNSVDITPHGELRLVQSVTDPHAHPIISVQCQTDETLGGQRGMICGASGGTGTTRFWVHDTRLGRQLDLADAGDRMRLQGKNANLWISWTHVAGGK